jgi:rhomboid protease GluP
VTAQAAVGKKVVIWATYTLVAVLLGVFGAEQYFAASPPTGFFSPSVPTLVLLGGLHKGLVIGHHQYFRLFSAVVLHANLFYLAVNGIFMFLAGMIIEKLTGRWWLGAIFVVSGLCRSLMCLAINSAKTVSVGASGAIMGLLASAFILRWRLPFHAGRTKMQAQHRTRLPAAYCLLLTFLG